MPLINDEINLILNGSANCIIIVSVGAGTTDITDTKLYVPVATLSIKDNVKLLKQLESRYMQMYKYLV